MRLLGALKRRRGAPWVALLLVVAAIVVAVALERRRLPARCPEGRVALGHRCCWEGQRFDGACIGPPARCAAPFVSAKGACALADDRVPIEAGTLRVAPSDWQAQGLVSERRVELRRFSIDRTEARSLAGAEPDVPLTRVSAEDAERHCRSRNGRLPTEDEWIFAASGAEGRRYPWGQTGLVCRRAVYGLERGPCASVGRAGPDAVGSRPTGATPEGILDLVGNVAEWVRSGGGYAAMGGSYRSRLASELKVWSREVPSGPSPHVGFRCVYDE